jgi:uncharacterized protein YjbI with pentapeptide repeats
MRREQVRGKPMLRNLYREDRVRISSADLLRALNEHERYATGRGGVRAQFNSADLSGQVLANRNLDEADFSGASLAGANLFGCSLVRASLYCADLRNCNLRNTKLTNADMRGASFKGADLSNSVLDNADLRAAMMVNAAAGAKAAVEVSGTMFGGVDFSHCSLRNTSFSNARLDGANFNDSLLVGTKFHGAQLTNAHFRGAVMMSVDLSDLPAEALVGCVMDTTPQGGASKLAAMLDDHERWVKSGGQAGAGAVLDGEDLRPLHDRFAKRSLIGLSARDTIAIDVDFAGAQLQGARFDGADLRGASFIDADLSGVSFNNARLSHARFDRTRLGTLHLVGGSILAPSFAGAEAFVEQFHAAVVFDPSILSPLPSCSEEARPVE